MRRAAAHRAAARTSPRATDDDDDDDGVTVHGTGVAAREHGCARDGARIIRRRDRRHNYENDRESRTAGAERARAADVGERHDPAHERVDDRWRRRRARASRTRVDVVDGGE